MAFGKRGNSQGDESETIVSETQGYIDVDDDDETIPPSASQASGSRETQKPVKEKDPKKPLIDEVTIHGAGKNQVICFVVQCFLPKEKDPNLIFKDLAKEFYWLNYTYKKGKQIVKFFLNHTHALSFFRENSMLELLKVAKTRFASHYILLRRLLDCREALGTTLALNSWREFVKSADENTKKLVVELTKTINDGEFWEGVEHILAFTYPIFLLVKFCNGEGHKMGEIYERMDNTVGEIKDAMKDNKYSCYLPKVEEIVFARWEKMSIPLHCLEFALNPKFYNKYYLEKLAPGEIQRQAPNKNKEVVVGVMEAFKRIAEDEEEQKVLQEQFATFHMRKGIYSRYITQAVAVTMDAIDWWATYGAETPELAEVALKVLSQPISSSSAERNWSTYSDIHNVKRNRLNAKRADKHVFIHYNPRLQSRFSESYKIRSPQKVGHQSGKHIH